MKRGILSIVVAATVWIVVVSAGQSQDVDNVKTFMRAKLGHAQKVIEGLATNDFDMIAKHSQEMSLLSQATTWQVLQTPEYMRRSAEFRRSTDALTTAAKEKNLDGATLAYVDVTLKCVECHKYVRRVRNARLDDSLLPGFGKDTVETRYAVLLNGLQPPSSNVHTFALRPE